jgi:eukaryotic-like serine/threonine-protein kinase
MAVHCLNVGNIYHRDIKPANILFKKELNGKSYLHLSDFGFAKNTKPDYTRDTTGLGDAAKGTVEYMAPEILDPPNDKKPDISKQDVWSIGVIAYKLCTQRLPFNLMSPSRMINTQMISLTLSIACLLRIHFRDYQLKI